MSDSESDSGSGSEVERGVPEITIESLQGRWKHKLGDFCNVKDADVTFDLSGKYVLVKDDNSVTCDGYRASLAKSTASKIIWEKEGEVTSWLFEGELEVAADGTVRPDEDVDVSNIITGKRRRSGVDYVAAARALDAAEGRDEDDTQDYDALPKSVKPKLLPSDTKSVSSEATRAPSEASSRPSEGSSRPSEGSSRSSEGSSSAKASGETAKTTATPVKKLKPSPEPTSKKMSLEEITAARDQLELEGALKPAEVVLPFLARLEKHPMQLAELKATKIGVAVNRYRKHPNATVCGRVVTLVQGWKGLMGS